MPLTPNGKADRKRLPDPRQSAMGTGTDYVAPRNELETKLAGIWEQLLEREKVSITDKFFDLGGDSIKVLKMLSEVKKELQLQIPIADVYNYNTIAALSDHVQINRAGIETDNRKEEEAAQKVRATIDQLKESILAEMLLPDKENIDDIYPMSDIEKGMIFSTLLAANTGIYHDQLVRQRTYLDFDIDRFTQAMSLLLVKHPTLRSAFNVSDYEEQVKIMYKNVPVNIPCIDISTLHQVAQETVIRDFMRTELENTFDITQAPLWRINVFKTGIHELVFIFQWHHAIIDGWSDALLTTELNNLYLALEETPTVKPSPLKSDYKDYIIQQQLDRQNEQVIAYWEKDLDDYKRLDIFTEEETTGYYSGVWDTNRLEELEQAATRMNTTVKVLSMSAYLYMLKVLNYENQIVIGLVTNTRPVMEDSEKLLGCFLNTVPLSILIEEQITCSGFVTLVNDKLLELKKHERLSLLEIAGIHGIHWGKENPFFDTFFNYVDFHTYGSLDEEKTANTSDVTPHTLNIRGNGRTNTYLDFTIDRTGGRYVCSFQLTRKLKSGLTPEGLSALYFRILSQLAQSTDRPLHTLDCMDVEEKQILLETFNATLTDYPKDITLIDLFEEQVKTRPDQTALICEGRTLSYKTLSEKADRLAAYLINEYQLQSGELAGIQLHRNEYLIVAMMAVLKTGAGYVPIEPDGAKERQDFIIAGSKCKLVIDVALLERVAASPVSAPVNFRRSGQDICALIYTSGSTGKPKGICISDRNLLNRLYWMWMTFPFNAAEVCAAKTAIGFVDHLWEIFGPLLKGIPLVVFGRETVLDAEQFITELSTYQVSRLVLVPSLLKQLLSFEDACREKLRTLKEWTCSGEVLDTGLVEKFYTVFPHHRLLNIYGSTEVTADATCFDTSLSRESVAISRIPVPRIFDAEIGRDLHAAISGKDSTAPIFTSMQLTKGYSSLHNIGWKKQSAQDYAAFINDTLFNSTVDVSSPRFIGHMTGPVPPVMRELADLMVSLNQNLVKFETSGIGTLVERQCIGMLHQLFYKNTDDFYDRCMQDAAYSLGIITSGGTMSNFTALSYALSNRLGSDGDFEGINRKGLTTALAAYGYNSVFVIGSERCHYSIGKTLKVMGLGTDAFITFDMEKDDLQDASARLSALITQKQQEGALVLAIIGVAGATESGSIDPLEALGAIAKKFNIHYHVDAAFGGGYLFSSRLKHKLEGIALSDSVTICGHKQLYLPMGLSVCLFRNELAALASENNTKYQARKESIDLGRYTIEGSRQFLSLILHGALNIVGIDGYAEIIESNYRRARLFSMMIAQREAFGLYEFPDLNIVLYRYIPPGLREKEILTPEENELVNQLNRDLQQQQFRNGHSFVSYTELRNKKDATHSVLLRAVLMNPYTTTEDLAAILDEQEAIGASLIHGENTASLQRKQRVYIGRPISNTRIYILNGPSSLAPAGMPGEICISGEGLTDGYMDQPELTAERFVQNPFNDNGLLYRTGDLGRWLPDGNIEYLGRKDEQVKIHGHRIEPGEIENALLTYPDITSAAVTLHVGNNGEKSLAAYITGKAVLDSAAIKKHLALRLPAYMLPVFYIQLDELPLTASGKTDKKRLPAPGEMSMAPATPYMAPRNAMEQQMAEIWQKILGVRQIGITDNFFERGGHSLSSMKLLGILKRELGLSLNIQDIYNRPTIAALIEGNGEQTRVIRFNNARPDSGINIYFIPPLLGNTILYSELADQLKEDFNCFGLQPSGLQSDEPLYLSIEEAAAAFYDEILKIQQDGPFIIFGYSMGAIIAFELAKRLADNYKNLKLILIDSPVKEIIGDPTDQVIMHSNADWLIAQYKHWIGEEDTDEVRLRPFLLNNMSILNQYRQSGNVQADVHVFESTDNGQSTAMKNWRTFFNGTFKHHFIAGDHWSALSPQNILQFKKTISSIYSK
jgi:putative pyridoxal-dependent aspartate 1-decarboxylase